MFVIVDLVSNLFFLRYEMLVLIDLSFKTFPEKLLHLKMKRFTFCSDLYFSYTYEDFNEFVK